MKYFDLLVLFTLVLSAFAREVSPQVIWWAMYMNNGQHEVQVQILYCWKSDFGSIKARMAAITNSICLLLSLFYVRSTEHPFSSQKQTITRREEGIKVREKSGGEWYVHHWPSRAQSSTPPIVSLLFKFYWFLLPWWLFRNHRCYLSTAWDWFNQAWWRMLRR